MSEAPRGRSAKAQGVALGSNISARWASNIAAPVGMVVFRSGKDAQASSLDALNAGIQLYR
jgi:hypothetical protein